MPNRLFRYDGKRWVKYEDNVRMTMSNIGSSDAASGVFAGKDVRDTYKTDFINNTRQDTIDGHVTTERQSLSQALKPKADN